MPHCKNRKGSFSPEDNMPCRCDTSLNEHLQASGGNQCYQPYSNDTAPRDMRHCTSESSIASSISPVRAQIRLPVLGHPTYASTPHMGRLASPMSQQFSRQMHSRCRSDNPQQWIPRMVEPYTDERRYFSSQMHDANAYRTYNMFPGSPILTSRRQTSTPQSPRICCQQPTSSLKVIYGPQQLHETNLHNSQHAAINQACPTLNGQRSYTAYNISTSSRSPRQRETQGVCARDLNNSPLSDTRNLYQSENSGARNKMVTDQTQTNNEANLADWTIYVQYPYTNANKGNDPCPSDIGSELYGTTSKTTTTQGSNTIVTFNDTCSPKTNATDCQTQTSNSLLTKWMKSQCINNYSDLNTLDDDMSAERSSRVQSSPTLRSPKARMPGQNMVDSQTQANGLQLENWPQYLDANGCQTDDNPMNESRYQYVCQCPTSRRKSAEFERSRRKSVEYHDETPRSSSATPVHRQKKTVDKNESVPSHESSVLSYLYKKLGNVLEYLSYPSKTNPPDDRCQNLKKSRGLQDLLKGSEYNLPEVSPSIAECAQAKKCGRIQVDKFDLCNSLGESSNLQKRQKQIDKLVNDTYCPGMIQEAVDATENFNDMAFQLAELNPKECGERPTVEPLTLLEAFHMRTNMERDALKLKIHKNASKQEIIETVQLFFNEKHNPTDLNRSLSSYLLIEILLDKMIDEDTKSDPFKAEVTKISGTIPNKTQQNYIMYTGITSPLHPGDDDVAPDEAEETSNETAAN